MTAVPHSSRRRLGSCSRGSALVQFAIVLPLFVALTLGGFEATRLIVGQQKIQHAAGAVADLVGQSEADLTEAGLGTLMAAARLIADPLDIAAGGRVILSSVTVDEDGARLNWQRSDDGALGQTSRIATGAAVVLPQEILDLPQEGEELPLIVAEVFFDYRPRVGGTWIPGTTLYGSAVLRPRIRDLTQVAAD